MIVIPEQCQRCKHYLPDKPGEFCAAFPDEPGIPRQILEMTIDHRQPFPGDHNIQWEPLTPGTSHPFEDGSE